MLSIIVPCYNEEEALGMFYPELKKVLSKISEEHEIVFVDDGSSDNTLSCIKQLAEKDTSVKFVSFSRNFGKEAALLAGLKTCKGDLVAVMDADMQDPPELLTQMIKYIPEYDCVCTSRSTRVGEPVLRSLFAKTFYKLMSSSEARFTDGERDFRLMKRKVVDAILSLPEHTRFSKGIFGWVGFKTFRISYENVPRVAGKTKWNFLKLFKYALCGINDFSSLPSAVMVTSGVVFSLLGCVLFVVNTVTGMPLWTLVFPMALFGFGIGALFCGINLWFLKNVYAETKQRPHYIISESNTGGKDGNNI